MALATPEERLAALAARKEYEKTQANQPTPMPTPTTAPAPTQGLNTDQQKRLDQVKSSPVYQDMINKGLTDEQITKAVQGYSEDKTQSLPQAEIKPATQTTATASTQADTKKTNEMTPQSFYLDDGEERQQTIISNLNAATINNPNSLKDQKTFRDFYNYDGRSDLQKKTLDTWFSGYQKGQDLSYKSANDIYSAYDTNNITISDLNNLKLANPAKYEEVNALIDKKTKLATYSQDLYGITETVNPFQSIIDNYTKGLQTLSASNFYNDYKEAMNSAAIKEQKLAIADKTTEIEKLDKEINEKKREVEKRYEGTGATRGKINAIIADELESLYSMRSNLTIDMNGAINKYNAEAGSIKEDFEMKQAEQQFNMQQRQQQMSELGFAMQLMSYETPKQQDERAWNNFIRQQEYTDGNIYSNDPKTRQRAVEKAVDRVLSEFQGIPMVRSREQMVSDIQRMVESGSDLGDAITDNIRKPIMNKPEYKAWSMGKLGISINPIKMSDSMIYDPITGRVIGLSSTAQTPQTTPSGAKYTPADPDKFSVAYQNMTTQGDGAIGGQCGAFVNDYLQSMGVGRLFVDPISAKKAVKNSDVPTIGSVAIIDWSNNPNATAEQKQYGHVGIVTAINNNGTVTLKQSNNKGDKKIFTSNYRLDQIDGYFDPTQGQSNNGGTINIDKQIDTDKNYKLANNILNGIGALPSKNDKNYQDVIEAMGIINDSRVASTDDQNLKDLLNSSKYDKPVDSTSIKQIQDIKTVLGGLSTLQGQLSTMKKDVGPIEGLLRNKNPYDVNAQSVAAQVNALAPKVARGVFGEVGVLTDTDIARYLKTIPNQKMTKNVGQVVGDLLKIAVYKSFINTVTTNAQAGRNMTNFIPDYKLVKTQLEKMGVSPYAFDTSLGNTQSQGTTQTFNSLSWLNSLTKSQTTTKTNASYNLSNYLN